MNIYSILQPLAIRGLFVALTAISTLGCEQSFVKPRTSADVPAKKLGLVVEGRSNGSITQVFVALTDKNGMIPLGPDDKLSIAEAAGRERPLIPFDSRYIAQFNTKATTFLIILRRGAARFVSTLEMPPPFSLVAYERIDPRPEQAFFDVRWSPSRAPTKMFVRCEIGSLQYDASPLEEGGAKPGSLLIPRRTVLDAGASGRRPGRSTEGFVVTAIRRGGKVILDPELADYPYAGTLEQIRIVTPMPYVEPKAAVAGEPAP